MIPWTDEEAEALRRGRALLLSWANGNFPHQGNAAKAAGDLRQLARTRKADGQDLPAVRAAADCLDLIATGEGLHCTAAARMATALEATFAAGPAPGPALVAGVG